MLTSAILVQQQKPKRIGLPPVFKSLTMFVFNPIADIAMMIKNLLKSLIGAVMLVGRLNTVVITEARRKYRINIGNIFFILTFELACFSCLVLINARASVIGMIARVLVSLTIVAISKALLPGCIPSQADAA